LGEDAATKRKKATEIKAKNSVGSTITHKNQSIVTSKPITLSPQQKTITNYNTINKTSRPNNGLFMNFSTTLLNFTNSIHHNPACRTRLSKKKNNNNSK
jgi:hypothetical protein